MLRRRLMVSFSAVSVAGLAVFGAAASGGGAQTVRDPVPFVFTGGIQTYMVPTDGSVCSITVAAAGANGGQPPRPPCAARVVK